MSLGLLMLGLGMVYSYFVMLSVSHVVLREEIAHHNEKLSDEVSRLERNYLKKSTGLTENTALSLGFRQTQAKVFVERGTYSLNASR